ncbi:MAG: hypothetical protein ACR2HJ_06215 [Fimbriimonadales bacterium]
MKRFAGCMFTTDTLSGVTLAQPDPITTYSTVAISVKRAVAESARSTSKS